MTTFVEPRLNRRNAGNLVAFPYPVVPFGLVLCLFLGMVWQYEEPSKIATLSVLLIVFALGISLIYLAARFSVIDSPLKWSNALLAKITTSFLITTVFWSAPLTRIGLMRSGVAFEGGQDSHLYDYFAVMVAENGWSSSSEFLYFTWQSFGIVAYIALVYSTFGVSILYVSMFNVLASLLAVLSLAGMLKILGVERSLCLQIRWGMLIPYVAYYDATPAKEPLTNAFYYFSIYLLARILLRYGRAFPNVIKFSAGIISLGLIRPNAVVMLFLSNVITMIKSTFIRGTLWSGIVIIAGFAAFQIAGGPVDFEGSGGVFGLFGFNIEKSIEVGVANFEDRLDVGDDPLKLAVGGVLLPRNPVLLVLLSPIRPLIWIFSPYPVVLRDILGIVNLPRLFTQDPIEFFRAGSQLFAVLSALLIIIWAPSIVAFALSGWRRDRSSRTQICYGILLSNLLIPALLIGNSMFIMGRRYRTLIEPLLFAIALVGMHYGRPEKYRSVVWAILIVGLVGYEAYSLLK